MFRRTAMLSLLAMSSAYALPRSALDISPWMHENDLELDDQDATKSSPIITDDVKQQVIKRYYEPLVASLDPNRVATGAECHWFKIRDKIFFPRSPSANFDKKLIDRLTIKAVVMLNGNNFKVSGLTITEPANDTRGNPFTYFLIGIVTGPIVIPTTPADPPKADPPKRRHGRRVERGEDDEPDSFEGGRLY